MKFRLVLLLTCFFHTVFSQYNSEFLNFEKTGRSVSINGEYELGSNGIYNGLLNKFIYGGFIDNNIKFILDSNLLKLHSILLIIQFYVNINDILINLPNISYILL